MSAPAQHIGECWQAAEFYANKLLMEFRGKDEAQVSWVRSLKVRAARRSHISIDRFIQYMCLKRARHTFEVCGPVLLLPCLCANLVTINI